MFQYENKHESGWSHCYASTSRLFYEDVSGGRRTSTGQERSFKRSAKSSVALRGRRKDHCNIPARGDPLDALVLMRPAVFEAYHIFSVMSDRRPVGREHT